MRWKRILTLVVVVPVVLIGLFVGGWLITHSQASHWLLESPPTDDGQLTIVWIRSGCDLSTGPSVRETGDEVEIIVTLRQMPIPCSAQGLEMREAVTLDAPLGDRALTGCQHDDCLELD